MSSSPQISYTVTFPIVLSSVIMLDGSGGSDLSADGHVMQKRKRCTNILLPF